MNEIELFNFEGRTVRIVLIDGVPWWVAKDVCDLLEIRVDNAMLGLDEDEKGHYSIGTPGGDQQVRVINESGLYSLILRSRKPEAKRMKKWLTSEVLPSIRKTGSYGTPALTGKELLAAAVLESQKIMLEAQQVITAMATQAAIDAPKVAVYERVLDTEAAFHMSQVATWMNMGEYTLFRELRERGILMSSSKRRWNVPHRKYMEHFRVVPETYLINGDRVTTSVTLVRATGISFVIEALSAPIAPEARQLSLLEQE